MFLSKEEMLEKGVDSVLNREEIDKVIEKDWKLDYLTPRYSDERQQVHFICDFHSWIGERPDRIHGFPVSKKMKEILEQFNLHSYKFYEAKVLFQGKYHEYFLWEQYPNGIENYIDFKETFFQEKKIDDSFGDFFIKVNSIKELRKKRREYEWHSWSFKKLIIKPEFKEFDFMTMIYPYNMLISERLKNVLEEANLTGFEIKPFLVEFEYL